MGGHPAIGVVLAGGEASRYGSDKALAAFRGTTLVARATDRLRSLVEEGLLEGMLLADRSRGLVAGIPSVADGPGSGPAAGILGAAAARPGRSLIVLACDLPNVPAELLRALASRAGEEAVVPRRQTADLEPLCALYGPASLDRLARRVALGEYALHAWVRELGDAVAFLDDAELLAYGVPDEIFHNVNRPQDLPAADS